MEYTFFRKRKKNFREILKITNAGKDVKKREPS